MDQTCAVLSAIGNESLLGTRIQHPQFASGAVADTFAAPDHEADQGGLVTRIDPGLAGCRIEDADMAPLDGLDQSEPQLGLGLAQPALTGHEVLHRSQVLV
jgi:hypothetical protein